MYGPGKSGTWDSSNTAEFLAYTINQSTPVAGFELGNELDLKSSYYQPTDVAKDFKTLRTIITQLWTEKKTPYPMPLIIGPDSTFDISWMTTFLENGGLFLDVLTYHMYIGYGGDPKLPQDILNPAFLNQTRIQAKQIVEIWQQYAPQANIWVGETAAAYDSGQNHTTNAFLDGFWYLDALGTLATLHHRVFCRQAFVGGNYELVDKYSHIPNPDYWSAWLWKTIMAQEVIGLGIVNGNENLRLYAHCSKRSTSGGIALVFINLSNTTSFLIEVNELLGNQTRYEYHLSSNELRSSTILLNGEVLTLDSQGYLPTIEPNIFQDFQPLIVQPLTYGFIDFQFAETQVCASK